MTLLLADEQLVAVDKPAGMLSVPGRGPERADCAASRVQAAYPDALIVHRLDMGTSGVLVFGRGADAQRTLSVSFAQRRVDKRYIAIVAGSLPADEGRVELPLICDWPNRPRQMVDHDRGKASTTLWRVLQRSADGATTRVELTPLTGRSHQLRVHMQQIGHPIVGDELYAPPDVQAMAPRLLLHAECLTLPHPADGRVITIPSPCPF
ncbi:RluA family pseudouridine synthase [Ideonella sp.]|uniref:RluA family pseudouridine synthase n=1 Tax=Ideonella sp. TaxID=1929293 RepID=UPI002E330B54|nr:RluA family pseudouridine synthase [Ideonella sp.]